MTEGKKTKSDSRGEDELLHNLSQTFTSVSPTNRKKSLETVIKYISKHNSSITRLQILKIWKGLYYNMWLSDKVLAQRELAVGISQLQRMFETKESFFSFLEEFYLMMRFRWDSMDHYRMDKFTFLQRTMLAESLDILKRKGFDNEFAEGLFNVYRKTLFTDIATEKSTNKKRKHSALGENVENNSEPESSDALSVAGLTGIGIPLIFCKQFPQEFVYLLYELFKLINKKSLSRNTYNEYITLLSKNYSNFIESIIKSCTAHSTLTKYIHSHLILKLFDYDSLLDQVLCEIEDLSIDQEERNSISGFLSKCIVFQMKVLRYGLYQLSKLNDNSIDQSKRNRIYFTLEKIDAFLKSAKDLNKLPRVSKNKKKASVSKAEAVNHKDDGQVGKGKRVRFDMSKNVRLLLPDSISTSKALVKIFDKKHDSMESNKLNCILFRSPPNSEPENVDKASSETEDPCKGYKLASLENVEIVSAEEALSKPSESNSSPSKGILRSMGIKP